MPASVLDAVSAHLEVVDRNVQRYFEMSDHIGSLFKSVKAVTISRYLGRAPFMRHRGGVMAKVSANGTGVFPVGTGMVLSHLTYGIIYSMRGYAVTDEIADTGSSDQAVINVAAEQVAGAMTDMAVDDDVTIHSNGDGTYTNACSSPVAAGGGTTTNTFIFAGAADFLRCGKLRQGQAVEVWSQTGATKRAFADPTQPAFITSIDYTTCTVVLSQNVVNACPAGSQDLFAVPGLDAYGPATLVSGSAAWPQTGLAGGLGGDSWRHGIYYANEVSTALSYLGRSRATFPELQSNRVNAGGVALNWSHGRQGLDQILMRGQIPQVTGLIGVAHMAQITAMENLTINMTSIQFPDANKSHNTPVDLAAFNKRYGTPTYYAGVPFYPSKRQPRNRLDTVNLNDWQRAQFFEPHFQKGGDTGQYLYRSLNAAGRRLTAYEFWLRQAYDNVCLNPMGAFYVDNLAASASYPF